MLPVLGLSLCRVLGATGGWSTDGFHVYPGENLQQALDAAARNPTNKVVKVHSGVYRPDSRRQALIWLNKIHDGIRLEAVGEVVLTAANPEISNPRAASHPAVVNHVVYLGDGLSPATVLEGFQVSGANNSVTTAPPEVETSTAFKKDLFFYADGGAIKIFGRSFPTLRNLRIVDNYASPCAGGISVQHLGAISGGQSVRIENCIFLKNRSQVTGAAVDLLPGSSAVLTNCLFISNIANLGENFISPNKEHPEFTNSAPVTVFPTSRGVLQRCTFTRNRNGVDDLGQNSVYERCVFWANGLGGAYYPGTRYELDIEGRAQATGCFFGGRVLDPNGAISTTHNVLNCADPQFDRGFKPTKPEFQRAGFEPGTNHLAFLQSLTP